MSAVFSGAVHVLTPCSVRLVARLFLLRQFRQEDDKQIQLQMFPVPVTFGRIRNGPLVFCALCVMHSVCYCVTAMH